MLNRIRGHVNGLGFQPAWLIFFIDSCILFLSALIVFFLLDKICGIHLGINVVYGTIKFSIAGIIGMLVTKSYRGVIRYTTFDDLVFLLRAITVQLVCLFVFESVYFIFSAEPVPTVFPFYFLSSLMCLFFFLNYRLAIWHLFFFSKGSLERSKMTGIFGAGGSGVLLLNMLKNDKKYDSSVMVFFDDDKNKCNKFISRIPVLEANNLEYYIKKYALDQIIVSPKVISNERKEELFEICKQEGILLRIIPSNDSWFMGRPEPENLHDIEITDLLGREQIQTNNKQVNNLINAKTILVTGAGGSIGSELSRQVIRQNPGHLILLDQAESPLYDISIELQRLNPDVKLSIFLSDLGNQKRMEEVFKSAQIDLVFHAAAYKHVPMLELHPCEAVSNNIKGTYHLANLSVKYRVEKFIMVSTDKAVNPTNIMGATKRAAEIYIQSLKRGNNANPNTQFITTRFGNVLGSNGSVVPLFKKQISQGGPITLTHPDITRFFMTIGEACSLVLEAATMGTGGEIFVFDMGSPVKIKDLAEKMISLSGKELGKDIEIQYIGLRDGEKLYEELLANGENMKSTHNKKVMIADVRAYEHELVKEIFNDVFYQTEKGDEMAMVMLLKKLIPEFKSNQSRFCCLDQKVDTIHNSDLKIEGLTTIITVN